MRKFRVLYKDREMSVRGEVYQTDPYPRKVAEEVAACLKTMGCYDFEYKEERT